MNLENRVFLFEHYFLTPFLSVKTKIKQQQQQRCIAAAEDC